MQALLLLLRIFENSRDTFFVVTRNESEVMASNIKNRKTKYF